MSGSFLVAMTDIYGDTNEVKARVDTMTDDEIGQWITDVEQWSPGRYEMDEDGTVPFTPDEMRTEIKVIVEEFMSYDETNTDLGVWPLGINQGWRYVSGGMSWGDSPTEAFDEIILMNCLPRKVLGGASLAMPMHEAFDLLTLLESNHGFDGMDNIEQQLINQIYEDGRE